MSGLLLPGGSKQKVYIFNPKPGILIEELCTILALARVIPPFTVQGYDQLKKCTAQFVDDEGGTTERCLADQFDEAEVIVAPQIDGNMPPPPFNNGRRI